LLLAIAVIACGLVLTAYAELPTQQISWRLFAGVYEQPELSITKAAMGDGGRSICL